MHQRVTVPARINIIGEHTDYAGGLALSFASKPRLKLTITRLERGYDGDAVVVKLWQAIGGYPAKLVVDSDIPIGTGMSSSAALCVAIVVGYNSRLDNVTICQKAQQLEHQILGTKCGLLDQTAIAFAKKNHAALIDFSSYSVKHIPIPEGWKFKLVYSGIPRKLAEINYQSNTDYLEQHVRLENYRVMQAIDATPEELGLLLNESHESLKKLGVSVPEVDRLVAELQATDGVLGARMMGGGYGGMVLALVTSEEVLPEAISVSSSKSFEFEEFS